MFDFFFDKIGELNNSAFVKNAFERLIFEKLKLEGYCDINPIIGRPKMPKSEIESNLNNMNSPLAKIFAGRNPKNVEELEKTILPVLAEMEDKVLKDKNPLDEYNYFAVIYYILEIYKNVENKLKCINEMVRICNDDNSYDYNFKMTQGIIYDENRIEVNYITSVNQYVDYIGGIKKMASNVFFRGHSKVSYDLKPSLFRKEEWLSNEKRMYLELISKCPYEFERLESHIEKLAEMQHYGLPTRLLDITQNPLIALYFSCESNPSYRGEIIVFSQDLDSIKYFQSDTVAMLASLPLFTEDEQNQFYKASVTDSSSSSAFNDNVERLVHEVRMERPGFKSEIRAEDIRKNVICIPTRKNRRLENQEGAFIVCGLLEEIYGGEKCNSLSNMRLVLENGKTSICIIDKKSKILDELDALGINKAKIYPEIDDVADYIKNHIDI